MSQARPRYSPVGSKPPVKPKSLRAVRYTPPFWAVPAPPWLVVPLFLLLLQAAASRVTTRASPTMLSLRLLLPIILASPKEGCRHAVSGSGRTSFRSSEVSALGAQRVTQPVPDQVERQRGDEQERPWAGQHPPGIGEELPAGGVGEHAAPRGRRLGHANAQEGQVR